MAAQPATVQEVMHAPLEESRIFEMICERAYELYDQRGCTHGKDIEDWLQAEAEVRANLTAKQVGKQS